MITFPAITALCAGLLGLVVVVLAGHVGSFRGKAKVGIGDGGNAELLCRIRKQGNYYEYVQLALITLGLFEMSGGAPTMAIAILGGMLVVSRILHWFDNTVPFCGNDRYTPYDACNKYMTDL